MPGPRTRFSGLGLSAALRPPSAVRPRRRHLRVTCSETSSPPASRDRQPCKQTWAGRRRRVTEQPAHRRPARERPTDWQTRRRRAGEIETRAARAHHHTRHTAAERVGRHTAAAADTEGDGWVSTDRAAAVPSTAPRPRQSAQQPPDHPPLPAHRPRAPRAHQLNELLN